MSDTSHQNKKIGAILLAGGAGLRMGSKTPKQFLPLHKKPIIHYSLEILQQAAYIQEIVVVAAIEYRHFFSTFDLTFALPGSERQESVFNGLQALSSGIDYVLIHDGARPFIQLKDLDRLVQAGDHFKAATLATPAKYTLKEANRLQLVQKTLDRSHIWEIQTPQLVQKRVLEQGFNKVKAERLQVTDDVSIAEHLGVEVKLVLGSYQNIKITTPEDLLYAEWLMTQEGCV